MDTRAPSKSSSFSIWKFLRKHFLTGIATLFPLFITIYIIIAIARFADNIFGRYINSSFYDEFGFTVPGLGIIAAFIGTLAVGLLYNYFFGNKVLPLFERMLRRIPLINNIYPPAKQLSDFMFNSEKKENFKKVVRVQFPEKGSYCIGFITNENIEEINPDGEERLVSIFVPLAPAPFTGHILLLPESRFKELDISVDRAIKFVVSGGVVLTEEEISQIEEAKQ